MSWRRGNLMPPGVGPWAGRFTPGPGLAQDSPGDAQAMMDPAGGGYGEYFIYSADFAGTAALAAGTANGRPSVQAFATFPIRIKQNANFRLMKTQYVATDPRVYVNYRDETAGRFLNRNAQTLSSVAGIMSPYPFVNAAANPVDGVFQPFVWPEPHVIAASSVWRVDAADYSGAPNTVRIAFHGADIRPGRAPWDRPGATRLPYTVSFPDDSISASVGALATQPFAVSIDNDADFIVQKITIQRTGAALVNILDGRDRFWMSTPQHIDNLGGAAGFPNILPAPRFVPRSSPIQLTITDLSGATNIVRIAMSGYRLY